MRLTHCSDIMPFNLIDALDSLGIRTAVDFVLVSPVDILHKLPQGTTSMRELQTYIDAVSTRSAAPEIVIIQALEEKNAYISCGVAELDALLSGGFKQGCVYELAGDRGVGKSDLALSIAVQQLVKEDTSEVLWMDIMGDVSIDRIESMFPENHSSLSRFRLTLAFDLDAAFEALAEVQNIPIHLLVIDAITPLVLPHLSSTSARGHAIMVSFMRQVRSLAQTHKFAVLVINTSTASHAGRGAGRKPSLGPTFPYLTDATLWMSRPFQDSPDLHTIELLRSKVAARKPGERYVLRQTVGMFEACTGPEA